MKPKVLEEISENMGEVEGLEIKQYSGFIEDPFILKRSPVKWCCYRPMKRILVYKKVNEKKYVRDIKSTFYLCAHCGNKKEY